MTLSRSPFHLCVFLALAALLGTPGCRTGGSREAADGSAEALADRGQALLLRGDREAALAEFARAIEVNPQLTRAHLGMGDAHRLAGDYGRAEVSYANAARVEPLNFDAQYLHGLVLHALNRMADAIGAYLRALQIRPESYEANLNLATAYYQAGEHRQAMVYSQSAVRLRPDDGPARANLGAVYAALDRHAEAVVEYQQAAEHGDLTPGLLLSLAESLSRLNRYEEMRNAAEQAVKAAPTAAAHERLGYARFKLREYEPAAASFRAALALDPDYFPALNGMGVCELNTYVWSERRDAAALERGLGHLRRSLQLNRNQPRIEELLTRYR